MDRGYRRTRNAFTPALCRLRVAASERQHAAGVLLVEHDVPAGVLQRRLVPVTATAAEPRGADVDGCLALDEPRRRVVRAARPVGVVLLLRERLVDRDPRPGLAWRLGAAPGEQQGATEERDKPDEAHARDASAACRRRAYGWRSSRMRAFLPTRPRR